MNEHHGVIELGDNDVEVVVSFDDHSLRLASGQEEVGRWDRSMYTLVDGGEGTFVIHAENEALTFKPHSPNEFARAAVQGRVPRQGPNGSIPHEIVEGPAPRLVTMVLFYLLAGVTLALGIWAAVSLIA